LVGMVLGRIIGSRLLHKIERNKVLLSSFALGILGFAIFWLSSSQSLSVIGLFIAGMGVANLYASMITLCFEAAGKERAAAGAATTLASGVAIFALPFALGSLADLISIRYAVLLIPFLFLVLALLFIFNMRSEQKKVRG
nr:MFS transporter [Anaerolineaceae bacterium]